MRGLFSLLLCLGMLVAGDASATGELGPSPANEPGPTPVAVVSDGETVARSVVTTAVVDREPVDAVTQVPADTPRLAFFSEIVGFEGKEIVHRWRLGSELMAEVPFRIGGPRWRVYSTKALLPGWVGDWTVEVVSEDGDVLARESFRVEPVAAEAPAAPAPDTTAP